MIVYHPTSGVRVVALGPLHRLWCLLLGPHYYLSKGAWNWALISFFTLNGCIVGLPLFNRAIDRSHYLHRGWRVDTDRTGRIRTRRRRRSRRRAWGDCDERRIPTFQIDNMKKPVKSRDLERIREREAQKAAEKAVTGPGPAPASSAGARPPSPPPRAPGSRRRKPPPT